MGKNHIQYNADNALGSTRSMHQTRNMPPLRRVWVKRDGGNPTTIMVGHDDIVDDLRSAISIKFPNSLARYYDPDEIQILLRVHPIEKFQQSRRMKPNKQIIGRLRPDLPEETQLRLPANTSHSQNQHAHVALEPDLNVWDILDEYFAGTMTMSDALLIDVEVKGTPDITSAGERQISREEYEVPASLSHERVQSPSQSWTQNRASPLSSNIQSFHLKPHQPIPIRQNSLGKYHSVSPNFLGSQSPPLLFSGQHKRSLSHPPQSLIPTYNQPARNGNPQAVLLLPKNFSLGEQNALKRFSDQTSKSDDGSNVSNIGNDASSPSSLTFNTAQEGTGIRGPISDRQNYSSLQTESGSPQSSNMNSSSSTTRNSEDLSKMTDTGDSVAKNSPKAKSKETTINTSTFEKVLPLISVLVVEDNSINQAILGAFLRKHKIHYQIAKNGQEAVDKWRKGGFHLVLMDIQLPVKSGIEATKEIRHLEKVNKIGVFAQHEIANSNYGGNLQLKEDEKLNLNTFRSPVIIVALTASSNSSVDKKNALTAGCNDFLTKPVNLVWLQNKITEWGCMQALIDFDEWRVKGSPKNNSQGKVSGEGNVN